MKDKDKRGYMGNRYEWVSILHTSLADLLICGNLELIFKILGNLLSFFSIQLSSSILTGMQGVFCTVDQAFELHVFTTHFSLWQFLSQFYACCLWYNK